MTWSASDLDLTARLASQFSTRGCLAHLDVAKNGKVHDVRPDPAGRVQITGRFALLDRTLDRQRATFRGRVAAAAHYQFADGTTDTVSPGR